MNDFLPGILAVGVSVVLVFVWLQFSGKTKLHKEVLFLRPRDKRGEDMDITKETDRSVLCEKTDPPHRFIKVSNAYVFKGKGRNAIRFFGVEGTAYTAGIGEQQKVNMSLPECLKALWTDKVYDALPQRLRSAIEKDKIGVTVEPEEIDPKLYGLGSLSSDKVNDEDEQIVLNRLAKHGVQENIKQKMLSNLIWLLLGIGMYALASNIFGG